MCASSTTGMCGLVLLAVLGCAAPRPPPVAPTGRIEGQVIEEGDTSPAAGMVIVRGNGLRGQAVTTPEGAFAFAVPPGTYDIVGRSGRDYVLRGGVEVVDGGVQQVVLEIRRRKIEPCTGPIVPPEVISGPNPQYTMQALDHGVAGEMKLRCILTVDGVVRGCVVEKGLPYMDVAVAEALEQRRYRPALCDGKPIEVDYSFRINLKPPW